MRVIAGSARRLLLVAPKGYDVRPTTDKTKETLFNCLMPYVGGADFLDLFAGSGAIGIEALSRGAQSAVFLENSRDALVCIDKNLETTHFKDKARVIKGDVFSNLKMLEAGNGFDIIFIDPPYDKGYEEIVLEFLSTSSLLREDGVVVVEASRETDFSYVEDLGFEMFKLKDYKNNKHVFLRKG